MSSSAAFVGIAQQDLKRIARFAAIDLLIDCVIFADGQVVGNDTSGYVQGLANQRRAASDIVARFNQAKANGTELTVALSDILNNHASPASGSVAAWQLQFAQRLLRPSKPGSTIIPLESFINYLQRLPIGPKLFNTTTGEKPLLSG